MFSKYCEVSIVYTWFVLFSRLMNYAYEIANESDLTVLSFKIFYMVKSVYNTDKWIGIKIDLMFEIPTNQIWFAVWAHNFYWNHFVIRTHYFPFVHEPITVITLTSHNS